MFCSNLGDLGSVVNRLDGADAEYGTARVIGRHVTRQWLERTGGQMNLLALRIPGRIVITALAYQPGAENKASPLCVSWLRTRLLRST